MGQETGLSFFYALTVLMFLAYLVFLAAASFWLVRFVYRKSGRAWLAGVTLVAILGVLLFDIPLGDRVYDRLCDDKAGVRVTRPVEGVRVIRYDQSICDSLCEAVLDKFDAVEMAFAPGRAFYLTDSPQQQPDPGRYRLNRLPDGWTDCQAPASVPGAMTWQPEQDTCVLLEPIPDFSARYLVAPQDWEFDGEDYGYGITSRETRIVDSQSGELIGEMNAYDRSGAFSWSRLSVLLHGPDQQFCPANPPLGADRMDFVNQVFP